MMATADGPNRIFVSYRRADASWPTRWLSDRLAGQFGSDVVFQDVDSIQPGDDFPAEIEAAVGSCSVLIAVIGPHWAGPEGDRRRLDDPEDWVRLEIETAIRREVRIIPVLVDGARMPTAAELPESLHVLARRQAVVLDPASREIGRLVSVLETALSHGGKPQGQARTAAGPQFPSTLPGVWNVPQRNVNFTDRSAELDCLHTWFAAHPADAVHALHGMGGVGKTQTAIEYAHRYAADYDLVWWVNAEQSTAIGEQFTNLADELGLSSPADPAVSLRAVHRALRARGHWLLIFDNAESQQEIRPLLPGGAGHVLVTTRRGGFRALGEVLDLDILNRPDALVLLRRRAPALTKDQADPLAAELGDLPLALDQAAAYLDQTGMLPERYLELLNTRGAELRSRGEPGSYTGTIATVWSVSIEKLQVTAPAAVQLLDLCAWLAPEPIPLDLFSDHPDQLPEPLASVAADPIAFNDIVGALVDYSLARRVGADLIVHRLVQDVTRDRLSGQPAAGAGKPLETVLALLRADLPGQIWATPASWPRWRTLLSSVLVATGYHTDATEGPDAAWLLTRAGIYLRRQGRYGDALPLHQRALRIDEAALDPHHPNVANDNNDIGWALSGLGRAAEALPYFEQALRIREAALGPDDSDVAADLNYVGQALLALGRPAEALPLQQRALRIREAILGPDHPYVAAAQGYVGQALSALGRPAEALPYYEQALRIREAAFGPAHPDVAADLNFVGQALLALGRADEALPYHERALPIDEAALGEDHPDVATDLNYIGQALSALGRADEALPYHEQALRIDEAALGPDHPLTRQSRDYVASARRDADISDNG
jgi:tetratricopeptide (TPR) repeat protein